MAPDSTRGARTRGRILNSARGTDGRQLHWPHTLLAKKQHALRREHLRYKQKNARGGVLHCFLLDCSGSMLVSNQLALAQGALRHLHQRAYQQRADIALIGYAGQSATVHIPATAARPFNALYINNWLPALQGGGGTPFSHGVSTADALLARHKHRNPGQQCWLWLLSDGRSNELPARPAHADAVRVIDCEQQRIALSRCRKIAEHWRAEYQTLNDLLEV